MRIIPSFKPAISYKQLNTILLRMFSADVGEQEITRFQHRFVRYLGAKYVIWVLSGRWALYYILESLNLKEGDEVILPAFTYFAVPVGIIKSGLRPVFVDINPQNLNISVQRIKENITDRTRVIIPTHLCGFVCKLDEILDIAHKHNITVIEDCAQSLGAEYKDKKVGSLGDASYFTFGITKNFTTFGGGMIATSNYELADRIRQNIMTISQTNNTILFFKLLKGYIMKFSTSSALFPVIYWIMRIFAYFDIDIVYVIFREKNLVLGKVPTSGQLNNIQAELGMAQLNDLDRKNGMRMRKGLEFYRRLKRVDNIQIPLLENKAKNIFSTCPILVKNKKEIKRKLLKKGIDTSSGYMQDCARLDIFKEFKKECPNASRAEDQILYFPVYAELSRSELIYIADTIQQIAG